MMNEKIAEIIKPLAKTATKLNLSKAQKLEELPVTGTHFGGEPYLETSEEYPVCQSCQTPLTFICQIDEGEGFHEKHDRIKLFTFFYCLDCFPWGISDEEKGQWLVRIYDQPGIGKFASSASGSENSFAVQPCLAATEKIIVYPDWDEIDHWTKEVEELFEREPAESPWTEYAAAVEALGGFDDFATTIGGYASWVQSEEILECGVCGNRLALLAQIDSEEKAGLNWGDSGLVYLFFCKEHVSEIKLILQCF
jgi:uncharacterized protein YwqG